MSFRPSGIVVLGFTVLLAQEGGKEEDLKNPFADQPEAVEAGRAAYLQSCSVCHGPNGEGGRGPRLANNGDIRGANNRRLFNSIKNGVRGSDMPPSTLDDDSIWRLVTYVKSINAPAHESKLAGNVENGGRIFYGKGGCTACHMIRGKGGVLGPDLTNLGMRSLPMIRESILQPSEKPTEGFVGVIASTKSGRKIEGIAKDNTNYVISVMDSTGRLHRLDKATLAEVVFKRKSLMPEDFGKRLDKQEIDDLLAFLSRQTARPPQPKQKDSKEK